MVRDQVLKRARARLLLGNSGRDAVDENEAVEASVAVIAALVIAALVIAALVIAALVIAAVVIAAVADGGVMSLAVITAVVLSTSLLRASTSTSSPPSPACRCGSPCTTPSSSKSLLRL